MIKLLVVDGQTAARQGFTRMLSGHVDIRVVGEAGNYLDALRAVARHEVDLTIFEPMMDDCDGFALGQAMSAMRPDMKLLIVSERREQACVLRALHMGAAGYMAKGAHAGDILSAIRTVASGERYICPRIALDSTLSDLLAMPVFTRHDDTPRVRM